MHDLPQLLCNLFLPFEPGSWDLQSPGWVAITCNYLLMGLSPIPLEVLHTFSLAKALVNGSARLSPDLTKSIVTEPSEINSLTVLCLRRICRDFPL